jgi:hypothetical protein
MGWGREVGCENTTRMECVYPSAARFSLFLLSFSLQRTLLRTMLGAAGCSWVQRGAAGVHPPRRHNKQRWTHKVEVEETESNARGRQTGRHKYIPT